MFINEFALTSEQRAGLYFALGCGYGEHCAEYPVLREEATYNAFREWIDALTTYHVCVTGANSKLDYAVAVVRSYIMFCYSVTPPELVPTELTKTVIDAVAVYVSKMAQLQYDTEVDRINFELGQLP